VNIGIVNDSVMAAELLRRLVRSTGQHEIVWIARDGAEAVKLCRSDLPELVLMDLLMPYMDGVEAIRRIMSGSPCPILVVTASVKKNAAMVVQALGAGAVDAVDLPGGAAADESRNAFLSRIGGMGMLSPGRARNAQVKPVKAQPMADRLLAIGASAGGPAALVAILSMLPQDFSAGVVIVQHIDRVFVPGLVEWLNAQSKLAVRLACEGDSVGPGSVLVACGEEHLVFKTPHQLGYTAQPLDNPYRPSIDVFFGSVAHHFRGPVTGVLLTGMGRDGAKGLKVLREGGAHTIAQDKDSCAVYGMPKAAVAIDAAREVLPLLQIGPRLREIFNSGQTPARLKPGKVRSKTGIV
jgi:two-component system, chemotaxis family, response regulator WspF